MTSVLRAFAARATGLTISTFARFMTAPRAIWQGIEPVPHQRVYFANHSSNGDFVLLWKPGVPDVKTLSVGMRGDDVRRLRAGLRRLRGLEPELAPNSVYDAELVKLVEDFQRAFGEAPGPLTSIALMTDTDNTASSAEAWYGPVTLT